MLKKVFFNIAIISNNELQELSEDFLTKNLHYLCELVQKQKGLIEGAIVIEFTDGNSVFINDDLSCLIQNLCFKSVSTLTHEKDASYMYRYMCCDLHVAMISMDKLIRVFSDDQDIKPFTCEKDLLLKELFQCGIRFLDLMSHLGNDSQNLVNHLVSFAREAENKLNRS